jgi:hypothetical protein
METGLEVMNCSPEENIRGEAKIVDVVFKDLSRTVLRAGSWRSNVSPVTSTLFPG